MRFSFQRLLWKGRIAPLPRVSTELAAVVEHALNLGSQSGDDGGVEERVKTGKDHAADNNADDDLNAGIDIALTGGGLDGGLGGDDYGVELVLDGVELVLDGVDKLFHRLITSFFLLILF